MDSVLFSAPFSAEFLPQSTQVLLVRKIRHNHVKGIPKFMS